MTAEEAGRLARLVEGAYPTTASVFRAGGYFAVVLVTESGSWTLYDEGDWQSWRSRIAPGR